MATSTLDRVLARLLPWATPSAVEPIGLAPVLSAYQNAHPKASTTLIRRAYDLASAAHEGQWRRAGDRYISHPLGVATILADLGLDDVALAAALLHDAVEDTTLTLDELEGSFGPEVRAIVDGVTKLDRLRFDSREAQQAATIRKMVVAMAADIRVLLIKLADRLDNMSTLAVMSVEQQRRIAQETLDIYAPLSHRLGLGAIKWQLEDLAFAALHPKRYAEIDSMVSARAPERAQYLEAFMADIRVGLEVAGVKAAALTGRPKQLWSIYEKMVTRKREFGDIYDLVGMRIICDDTAACYGALGVVHAMAKPIAGRFKDYISLPKFNLYQSLHTTVVGPGGKPIEVQIRTVDMDLRAERGVAAHWSYKTRDKKSQLAWIDRMVDLADDAPAGGGELLSGESDAGEADAEFDGAGTFTWQAAATDPAEFLRLLQADLQSDEIFVFSPRGKVVSLPTSSGPLDFAYAIHTEVGHRCIGAKVNGRMVSLDSRLSAGDTVEILTSKDEKYGPRRDWMGIVHTPRARAKVRQWFNRERREDALELGRDELQSELRREGVAMRRATPEMLTSVAAHLHLADPDALFLAIAQGHVSAKSVAHRVAREVSGTVPEQPVDTPVPTRRPLARGPVGVHVEGLDDVLTRLARCCLPVPGDVIIGFVTRGRGVSVHRADCANAATLTQEAETRVVEVEWDGQRGTYLVEVEARALDREGLLADITRAITEHRVNITAARTATGSDQVARLRFDIELGEPDHLAIVLGAMRSVESVYDAYRVLPAAGRGRRASYATGEVPVVLIADQDPDVAGNEGEAVLGRKRVPAAERRLAQPH